ISDSRARCTVANAGGTTAGILTYSYRFSALIQSGYFSFASTALCDSGSRAVLFSQLKIGLVVDLLQTGRVIHCRHTLCVSGQWPAAHFAVGERSSRSL